MRRWLLRQGVPADRIIADFAGRRTYASLKRARMVFGLERTVVVTSDFHMPRALFLADKVGLTAWGVPADTRNRSSWTRLSFWSRELTARHLAVLDGWFPPDVVLGPRERTPEELAGPR
jgi:SanA protein